MNRTKAVYIFILATCAGLILKKQIVPGASLLLFVSLISLCGLFFTGFISTLSYEKSRNPFYIFSIGQLCFSISSIAFLFQVHYWQGARPLVWTGFSLLMILTFLLLKYFLPGHTDEEITKRVKRKLLLPLLFFVLVIPFSAFSNQRQFHSLFRASTYESYVRKMYPEEKARQLLEDNQCTDPSCLAQADSFYKQGLINDSLKKYDEAFTCYNKAVNLNIHFAEAYVQRAENRMLHAVHDPEMMKDAFRDCDLAIAINPRLAHAYLRRGFLHVVSGHRDQACADFKKAKEVDNTLKIDYWITNSCRDAINKK